MKDSNIHPSDANDLSGLGNGNDKTLAEQPLVAGTGYSKGVRFHDEVEMKHMKDSTDKKLNRQMMKSASGFSSRRNRLYDDDQSQDEDGNEY